MAQDYAAAGHSVLADLVTRWDIHIYLHISTHIYTHIYISRWGGQWWEHGTNLLDCVHQHEGGGGLYVGGWQAAGDLQLLRSRGITHVVNCTTDLQCPHTEDVRHERGVYLVLVCWPDYPCYLP